MLMVGGREVQLVCGVGGGVCLVIGRWEVKMSFYALKGCLERGSGAGHLKEVGNNYENVSYVMLSPA